MVTFEISALDFLPPKQPNPQRVVVEADKCHDMRMIDATAQNGFGISIMSVAFHDRKQRKYNLISREAGKLAYNKRLKLELPFRSYGSVFR